MRFFQAGILEWVAMPFSRWYSWTKDQTCGSYVYFIGRQGFECVYVCVCLSTHTPSEALYLCCVLSHFSRVLFSTLWIIARQALLSMGLPRQEYWSGLPCPPPGHLPDTGIEPMSPWLQADSFLLSHLVLRVVLQKNLVAVAEMFEKYVGLQLCKLKLLIRSIDNYNKTLINDCFVSVI